MSFKTLSVRYLYIITVFIFCPFFLSAAMGPGVSVDMNGKALKWEEGSRDYFVMFKSLLLNLNRTTCLQDCQGGQDKVGNPQADKCMDPAIGSTFVLQNNHIPLDAYVESAYLVWTSSMDRQKLDDTVDNKVTLSFTGLDSGITYSKEIVGPEHHLNESDGFTYSGKKLEFPMFNGYGKPYQTCSVDADCAQNIGTYAECVPWTDGKTYCGLRQGIYTYRVDVTDFFKTLHDKGNEAGIGVSGLQLLGKYTVTGMDCTDTATYLNLSGLIGGWALIMVYTSEQIFPKKIYVYDDLDMYQFKSSDINVTGFELPTDANVKLTLHTLEGDPGLSGAVANPNESIQIRGAQRTDWVQLQNACNPPAKDTLSNPYTEIYNSVSSMFGWADENPICIGNSKDPNSLEYAMDVDTLLISATDPLFEPHLQRGDTSLNIKVSSGLDGIYTNFLVLSIDTRAPKFDIPITTDTPDGREKNACSCSTEKDMFCDSPFYYTIKVQNWGDNAAVNVRVRDALPEGITYVSGTTQIATSLDESGKGLDWKTVEDASGGSFPLAENYPVSDLMEPCDQTSLTCENTVLIRFKVQPEATLPKNAVLVNIAEITDSTGTVYKTNSSVPLRMKRDSICDTSCLEPSLDKCSGAGGEPIQTGDSDSKAGNDSTSVSDNEINDDGEMVNSDGEVIVEDGDSGCGCTLVM